MMARIATCTLAAALTLMFVATFSFLGWLGFLRVDCWRSGDPASVACQMMRVQHT